MHSYFSYVNGQDVLENPGQRWLYCLRASAFLRNVLPSLSLKRDLEMGRRGSEEAGPDVVARVALSSQETLEAALEAAAAAAPAWAAMPLETRMYVGQRFHLGGMAFISSGDVALLAAASHAIGFHPPSRAAAADPLGGWFAGAPLVLT